jgi:hypothetical protein
MAFLINRHEVLWNVSKSTEAMEFLTLDAILLHKSPMKSLI